MDPYSILWYVFLRERLQVRFTELQLNTRLEQSSRRQNTKLAVSSRAQRGSVTDKLVFGKRECRGQTSVQSKLCPTSLASAPKGKLTRRCCIGFYGRQSVILAHMHICMHTSTYARMHARTHAHTHARTHARTHACTPFFSFSFHLHIY
jgi:hypothetical protein